jgi:hypothetical protein
MRRHTRSVHGGEPSISNNAQRSTQYINTNRILPVPDVISLCYKGIHAGSIGTLKTRLFGFA